MIEHATVVQQNYIVVVIKKSKQTSIIEKLIIS